MTLSSEIENFSKIIDSYIKEKLKERTTSLYEPCYHYIKAGGKRLRPFMIYQAYKLFNDYPGSLDKILPIASAMEILHNFTLIHDDIMDNDKTRRGVTAVHEKWGIPTAILAGDALLGIVTYLVSISDFDENIKNKINHELSIATIELCEGQAKDIEFEKRNNVIIDEYMQMIQLKTATLFEKSCHIGGIAANASHDKLKALKSYGQNLGITFQIIDDIIGLTAIEKDLGKPVGSDISRGKKTYLVINSLNKLKDKDKKEFTSILSKGEISNNDLKKSIDFIINSGSLEKAKKIANKHKELALEQINIFPDSDSKKTLIEISNILMNRTK